jgi:hypothetical protein
MSPNLKTVRGYVDLQQSYVELPPPNYSIQQVSECPSSKVKQVTPDKPQLHPTSAPALIHRVVVVGFPLPSPSLLLSVPFIINDFYNELGLLERGFAQLDFPAAVCQVGPVFKKPTDTKKLPPSDSVGF